MSRYHYLDKLKVFLTLVVIAYHTIKPYAPIEGGWVVNNPEKILGINPLFNITSAFFMPLFFLLAGLFVPASLAHKGSAGFIKSRFIRLGLPAYVVSIFGLGPMSYFLGHGRVGLWEYLHYLYATGWQPLYIHLWFLVHLLFYSLLFVAWQRWFSKSSLKPEKSRLPGTGRILLFILALSLVIWLVRIHYPLDHWVGFLVVIPAEMAHLPHYMAMFFLGTLAMRRGWLDQMPGWAGLSWLAVGLASATAFYLYRQTGQGFWFGIIAPGGFNWPSLVWSVWETLMCVSFCIGLVTLAKLVMNSPPGKLQAWLIPNAYGAYVFHIFFVIPTQLLLVPVPWSALTKFLVVTLVAALGGFTTTGLLRRMAWARRIF